MDSLQEVLKEWCVVSEKDDEETLASIVTLVDDANSCFPSLNSDPTLEPSNVSPSLIDLDMHSKLQDALKKITEFRDFQMQNNLILKQQKAAILTLNQIHTEKLDQINELSAENEGLKCKAQTLEANIQEGLKDMEALTSLSTELEEKLVEVQDKLMNQLSADFEEITLLRKRQEKDSEQLRLLIQENLQLKKLLEQKETTIDEQMALATLKDWKVARLELEVTEVEAKARRKETEVVETKERIKTFECSFETLQAELTECKVAFDKERESWQKLSEETDNLSEDLLSVQLDNLNLTFDVDAMRRQQNLIESLHHPRFYVKNEASGILNRANVEPKFECPYCFLLFESLDLLQINHIDSGDCTLMPA